MHRYPKSAPKKQILYYETECKKTNDIFPGSITGHLYQYVYIYGIYGSPEKTGAVAPMRVKSGQKGMPILLKYPHRAFICSSSDIGKKGVNTTGCGLFLFREGFMIPPGKNRRKHS
jgi:hypothetical protein